MGCRICISHPIVNSTNPVITQKMRLYIHLKQRKIYFHFHFDCFGRFVLAVNSVGLVLGFSTCPKYYLVTLTAYDIFLL